MTPEAIKVIMPNVTAANAALFAQPLTDAMDMYEINTPMRQAMFMAQIAQESGQFRYMEEISNGSQYEGRKDLGNVHPGDGEKYKGRGLIEITGFDNYQKCSLAIYGDERLLDTPDMLEQPFDACVSAAWFWKDHGLNEIADSGDFAHTTKIINGGYNGQAEREAFFERAKAVLVAT